MFHGSYSGRPIHLALELESITNLKYLGCDVRKGISGFWFRDPYHKRFFYSYSQVEKKLRDHRKETKS